MTVAGGNATTEHHPTVLSGGPEGTGRAITASTSVAVYNGLPSPSGSLDDAMCEDD
jgi:hypothetical protein